MAATAELLQRWITRLLLRSELAPDEIAALADLPVEHLRFEANRDFVRLGEHTTHACVIVRGLAARFDQTASGARQITALHVAGDAADLHSVPLPRSAGALQALTPTEIARVPHAAIRELLARFPAIGMAFWRDCMVDAAILSKWALNIGRASARQRMAHLLCEMAVRRAVLGGTLTQYELRATQTHLGDMTGLTNVHVNRTLRALASEGLATVRGGTVHIEDWERLVSEADFDIAYLHLPENVLKKLNLTN